MMRNLYILYGVIVLGTLGMAEYRGWSLDSVDEVKNVPGPFATTPVPIVQCTATTITTQEASKWASKLATW